MFLALAAAYAFGSMPTRYHLAVEFDGYLPVLGGKQGKAVVDMDVDVTGGTVAPDGTLQATSEIKEVTITLNGAKLPLTVKSMAAFFPKTTAWFTPGGHIVKTDAPDVAMPVRLPGLDPKRFPDITYLPIEFPAEGLEVGKGFQFKKSFGGADVAYTVTPTAVGSEKVELKLDVEQAYDTFEDANRNQVEDAAHGAFKVSTTLKGGGTATYFPKRGIVGEVSLKTTADSKVTPIAGGDAAERHLAIALHVSVPAAK